jgi:hypothetical protein
MSVSGYVEKGGYHFYIFWILVCIYINGIDYV